jgi:hypothetical protein
MIDPSAPPQMVASADEPAPRGAKAARETRESRPAGDDDEQPGKHRNLEDEEAPIMGAVREASHRRSGSSPSGPSKYGSMFWAGVGTLIGGVALVGGGVAFGMLAKQKSDLIAQDAANPVDMNGNHILYNNDPNAGGGAQEADLAAQGKMFDQIGIALDVIGGVAVAGGATLMILDQLVFHGGQKERPHKRRAQPAPRDEELSQRTPFYVAPSAGHHFAGVAGGFKF